MLRTVKAQLIIMYFNHLEVIILFIEQKEEESSQDKMLENREGIQRAGLVWTTNYSSAGIFRPQNYFFDFAFQLNNKTLDPRYGHLSVNQVKYYISDEVLEDGTRKRLKKLSPLNFTFCQDDLFNYTNKQELMTLGINEYFCLKDQDYTLQGGYYDEVYEYLEIKLYKCQNKSDNDSCYPIEMIDQYFLDEELTFAFTNTYLDYRNSSTKSKNKLFIDDSFYLEIDSSRNKKANLYVQKQEASYQDDYIQFGQERNEEFFQVQNIQRFDDNYSPQSGVLAAVYIRFDNRYDIYQVKNYAFLEYLGDIGGLYGALSGIGIIFVSFFSQRMYISDILKRIYQVRKSPLKLESEIQRQQRKSDPDNKKLQRRFTLRQYHQYSSQKLKQEQSNTAQQTTVKIDCEAQSQDSIQKKYQQQDKVGNGSYSSIEKSTDEQKQTSMKVLQNEKFNKSDNENQIKYNDKPQRRAPSNSLKMIKIDSAQLRRSKTSAFEDQKFQSVVIDTPKDREQNVAKQLDEKTQLTFKDLEEVILSIIHRTQFKYGIKKMIDYMFRCICLRRKQSLRFDKQNKVHYLFRKGKKKLKKELDIIKLLKSLRKFKLLQQAMLPQKSRVLLSYQRFNLIETDSSSSDSDDDKKQTTTLMESKNPLIRLFMYGKIKKMMQQFLDKNVEPLEFNLVRGVFKRRLKDFSEKMREVEDNLNVYMRNPSQVLVLEQNNSKKYENFGYAIEQQIDLNLRNQTPTENNNKRAGILKKIQGFKTIENHCTDFEISDSEAFSQSEQEEKNEYGVEDIQLNRDYHEEEINNYDSTRGLNYYLQTTEKIIDENSNEVQNSTDDYQKDKKQYQEQNQYLDKKFNESEDSQ
ncbi:UNKNOWN [Stylonychia lemnae]|uniref:Uncharacterized protein n=1 Tax=Stylonychia lemnae TaxID=5949 RepID=A0A077ZZT5_STYLE|nr:UNKNOWN [Stylonychia lemnae]|eukprot:CDW74033.1 UNKNOWN [Stylonychia lemnae]